MITFLRMCPPNSWASSKRWGWYQRPAQAVSATKWRQPPPTQTPTVKTDAQLAQQDGRLHALLGNPDERKTRRLKQDHIANLINFYTQCFDKLDNRSICVFGFKYPLQGTQIGYVVLPNVASHHRFE